jgi:hypothetical protein
MPDDRQEIKVFLNFVPVCKTAEAPDPLIPSEVEGRTELPARSLGFARDVKIEVTAILLGDLTLQQPELFF